MTPVYITRKGDCILEHDFDAMRKQANRFKRQLKFKPEHDAFFMAAISMKTPPDVSGGSAPVGRA